MLDASRSASKTVSTISFEMRKQRGLVVWQIDEHLFDTPKVNTTLEVEPIDALVEKHDVIQRRAVSLPNASHENQVITLDRYGDSRPNQ